ncbi:MAG: DUF2281 domain-containing protein [Pseudomonadota bacterium]
MSENVITISVDAKTAQAYHTASSEEWSRDMNQEELWREIKSLPPQAQRELADFVAFLRFRYQPPCPTHKTRKRELADEPFIGMWRNRKDMEDSSKWVKTIRGREWKTA